MCYNLYLHSHFPVGHHSCTMYQRLGYAWNCLLSVVSMEGNFSLPQLYFVDRISRTGIADVPPLAISTLQLWMSPMHLSPKAVMLASKPTRGTFNLMRPLSSRAWTAIKIHTLQVKVRLLCLILMDSNTSPTETKVDSRSFASNFAKRICAQRDMLKNWLTGAQQNLQLLAGLSLLVTSHRMESLSSEVESGTSLGASRMAQWYPDNFISVSLAFMDAISTCQVYHDGDSTSSRGDLFLW